jgi:hypothetical protein
VASTGPVLDRRTFLKAAAAATAAVIVSPLVVRIGALVARAQGPASTTDIAGLANQLDYDQAAIFRFVADEVGFDPYPGALRGATGTLWSRAGSSADQALLLASLLDEALVRYRFAIGTIDDTVATYLAASGAVDVATGRTRAAATLLPPDVAAAWTGSGPWQRAPEVEALFGEARDRTEATVDMLERALSEAGIELATREPSLPEGERTQHVWIQASSGPDWVDLDPSVPGSQPGVAYAAVMMTTDTLPDELYHTVTVRVDAEIVQGGVPVRTPVLSHEVRAADLPGKTITLVHPNPEWLGLGSALSGVQQYQPTLLVGDGVVAGSPIVLGAGGGVAEVLGSASDNEGQATAEWLTVDLAIPGGASRSTERTVFDRLGPDVRAAGPIDVATLAPVETVDAGESLGRVFLPLAGMVSLAVTSHPVPASYFAQDSSDEPTVVGQVAHAFSYLRDLMRLEAVGDRSTARYFADEPGVTAFWSAPTAIAADGRKDMTMTVDILHAHHASLPFSDAHALHPAGLVAGAVDHAGERMVIEGTFSIVPDPPDRLSFVSVGRLFELAAEQGIPLVVLRPGAEAEMPAAGAAPSALIMAALAAGSVVVVPSTPITIDGLPRIGWWEIDPSTGLARDRLDDGGGQTLGEYLAAIHELATWAGCVVSLGMAVRAVVQGATQAAVAWGAVGVGVCIAAGAGGIPHVGPPH